MSLQTPPSFGPLTLPISSTHFPITPPPNPLIDVLPPFFPHAHKCPHMTTYSFFWFTQKKPRWQFWSKPLFHHPFPTIFFPILYPLVHESAWPPLGVSFSKPNYSTPQTSGLAHHLPILHIHLTHIIMPTTLSLSSISYSPPLAYPTSPYPSSNLHTYQT